MQESLRTDAYIYALLNFVFPFLGGLLLVHANRLAVLAQVKITAALIAELFRKATRMSIECVAHANALLCPALLLGRQGRRPPRHPLALQQAGQ